jgi:hypothetical protein
MFGTLTRTNKHHQEHQSKKKKETASFPKKTNTQAAPYTYVLDLAQFARVSRGQEEKRKSKTKRRQHKKKTKKNVKNTNLAFHLTTAPSDEAQKTKSSINR